MEVGTVAGSHRIGGEDGSGGVASFNSPSELLALPDGSILVADTMGDRIRRIFRQPGAADALPSGARVVTVSARGWLRPMGMALLPDGSVLVCDHGHNRVKRLSADLKTVSLFAGTGLRGSRDGPADAALFDGPRGVCVWGEAVLVSDGHAIRAIVRASSGTNHVATIAGGAREGYRDGPGLSARFCRPSCLLAYAGAVLVCDTGNHCVRHLLLSYGAPNGAAPSPTPVATVLTLCGRPTAGCVDGALAVALFRAPSGLLALPHNELLISDSENNALRKLSLKAESVTTIAGSRERKWGVRDGPAEGALLNLPRGLALGSAGSVLVADSANNCVRALVPPAPEPGHRQALAWAEARVKSLCPRAQPASPRRPPAAAAAAAPPPASPRRGAAARPAPEPRPSQLGARAIGLPTAGLPQRPAASPPRYAKPRQRDAPSPRGQTPERARPVSAGARRAEPSRSPPWAPVASSPRSRPAGAGARASVNAAALLVAALEPASAHKVPPTPPSARKEAEGARAHAHRGAVPRAHDLAGARRAPASRASSAGRALPASRRAAAGGGQHGGSQGNGAGAGGGRSGLGLGGGGSLNLNAAYDAMRRGLRARSAGLVAGTQPPAQPERAHAELDGAGPLASPPGSGTRQKPPSSSRDGDADASPRGRARPASAQAHVARAGVRRQLSLSPVASARAPSAAAARSPAPAPSPSPARRPKSAPAPPPAPAPAPAPASLRRAGPHAHSNIARAPYREARTARGVVVRSPAALAALSARRAAAPKPASARKAARAASVPRALVPAPSTAWAPTGAGTVATSARGVQSGDQLLAAQIAQAHLEAEELIPVESAGRARQAAAGAAAGGGAQDGGDGETATVGSRLKKVEGFLLSLSDEQLAARAQLSTLCGVLEDRVAKLEGRLRTAGIDPDDTK